MVKGQRGVAGARLRLGVLTVILVNVTSCALFRGEETGIPPTELEPLETRQAELATRAWVRPVGDGEDALFRQLRPYVAGERVYTVDYLGELRAFDRFDGTLLWKRELGEPITGGVGGGAGHLFIGAINGDLIALDAEDGATRWRTTLSSEVLSPAVAVALATPPGDADDSGDAESGPRGRVFVRTGDGGLVGLNLADGRTVWSHFERVPALNLRGNAMPSVIEDSVVAGFDNGRLRRFSGVDGAELWEVEVGTPRGRTELERMVDIDGRPLVDDTLVIAGAFQAQVGAYDLDSGRERWTRELSTFVPIAGDLQRLYVTDETRAIWALDRRSGGSMWKQEGLIGRTTTAPCVIGEHLLVGDFEGFVHLLSVADGGFVDRIDISATGFTSDPICVEGPDAFGRAYLLSEAGRIFALEVPLQASGSDRDGTSNGSG